MRVKDKIWTYDRNNKIIEALPCPFCGSEFVDQSYDRGIKYTCPKCHYSRSFPGLVQSKKSKVNSLLVKKKLINVKN